MTEAAAGRDVILCECFARDGLQNEPRFIETGTKVELLDGFAEAGFARIEATSFAHPKIIPQFSDAETVLRSIGQQPRHARFKATCANERAVGRAVAAQDQGFGPEEISFIISASESHCRKNLNRSRDEQWRNIARMAEAASGRFVLVGALSVVFGCPFEGAVDTGVVIDDARRFRDIGAELLTLGDTVGLGHPVSVKRLCDRLRAEVPGITPVAHFHNTRGAGLANCVAAFESGVRYFDASFGGVGGHPAGIEYGEGNTGNVPTEDLVVMFESMGIRTGLNLAAMMQAARRCEAVLGRQLLGMITRTSYAGQDAPSPAAMGVSAGAG